MANVLVWMSDELHNQFRDLTRKKGLTMSKEIRKMVLEWVEKTLQNEEAHKDGKNESDTL